MDKVTLSDWRNDYIEKLEQFWPQVRLVPIGLMVIDVSTAKVLHQFKSPVSLVLQLLLEK